MVILAIPIVKYLDAYNVKDTYTVCVAQRGPFQCQNSLNIGHFEADIPYTALELFD